MYIGIVLCSYVHSNEVKPHMKTVQFGIKFPLMNWLKATVTEHTGQVATETVTVIGTASSNNSVVIFLASAWRY
jgi:hypothetical protein